MHWQSNLINGNRNAFCMLELKQPQLINVVRNSEISFSRIGKHREAMLKTLELAVAVYKEQLVLIHAN